MSELDVVEIVCYCKRLKLAFQKQNYSYYKLLISTLCANHFEIETNIIYFKLW